MKMMKKGASIISLALCVVAITLVTTALVVATNNSAEYRASKTVKENRVVESYAYVKTYSLAEVETIARQAYANNYLSFYDKEVDLEGLYALVVGEMMQVIPQNQLEDYDIIITSNGVDVKQK